ncbi:MAG TPA: thiamine pyrophosphate-binding protein, partial [Kineosporiaceae bacterium]|nr:thiamine pyrophosphate-binding protein [Kineosporiaceae bacterium]
MKLTAGQIIARGLKEYGVTHMAGLPGHGNWSLLDALHDEGCELDLVQTFHEQSAVHLADAFYRASGRIAACTTSIGPGAMNAVMGLATAYADSTATVLFNGSPSTHQRGHGVLQELDRGGASDFARVVKPVTKRNYEVFRADELPFILHRAFNAMLSGRPGPVQVDLPLDVQVDTVDVEIADLARRLPVGEPRPDADAVQRAARLLSQAERPVIVAGGGAVMGNASAALVALAEKVGAAVVFTWNGKGAIPEDHPLCAGTAGWPGSTSGNGLASTADVVLSVGCKFTDWSTSSWRKGVTFSFPPAKLIQVDIDAYEIGKNYPADVGIVAGARAALQDISDAISSEEAARIAGRRDGYRAEITRRVAEWEGILDTRRSSDASPMTMHRALRELRGVLPRDGIVTVGSGNPQSTTKQGFPVYGPRTHLTSGSMSSMGFAVPAAIGAKIACPDQAVVAIVGDGDFMQTMQELAVCAMRDLPVVFLVLNNKGYVSIAAGENGLMTRNIGSYFDDRQGKPYSVDFAAMGKSFGFDFSRRTDRPDELGKLIGEAIAAGEPALIEAEITRELVGGAEV